MAIPILQKERRRGCNIFDCGPARFSGEVMAHFCAAISNRMGPVYPSVELDDPRFPEPIYAALFIDAPTGL